MPSSSSASASKDVRLASPSTSTVPLMSRLPSAVPSVPPKQAATIPLQEDALTLQLSIPERNLQAPSREAEEYLRPYLSREEHQSDPVIIMEVSKTVSEPPVGSSVGLSALQPQIETQVLGMAAYIQQPCVACRTRVRSTTLCHMCRQPLHPQCGAPLASIGARITIVCPQCREKRAKIVTDMGAPPSVTRARIVDAAGQFVATMVQPSVGPSTGQWIWEIPPIWWDWDCDIPTRPQKAADFKPPTFSNLSHLRADQLQWCEVCWEALQVNFSTCIRCQKGVHPHCATEIREGSRLAQACLRCLRPTSASSSGGDDMGGSTSDSGTLPAQKRSPVVDELEMASDTSVFHAQPGEVIHPDDFLAAQGRRQATEACDEEEPSASCAMGTRSRTRGESKFPPPPFDVDSQGGRDDTHSVSSGSTRPTLETQDACNPFKGFFYPNGNETACWPAWCTMDDFGKEKQPLEVPDHIRYTGWHPYETVQRDNGMRCLRCRNLGSKQTTRNRCLKCHVYLCQTVNRDCFQRWHQEGRQVLRQTASSITRERDFEALRLLQTTASGLPGAGSTLERENLQWLRRMSGILLEGEGSAGDQTAALEELVRLNPANTSSNPPAQ